MANLSFRKATNISKDLEKYYEDYFLRNTTKFFNKWDLKESDLGTIFIKDEEEYSLIGQINENRFILKKKIDETNWFVEAGFLHTEFVKKGG